MTATRITCLVLAIVMLSGCANMTRQQQRALSGGAIGAAGGMLLGAATGGSMLTGGLIGAGAGAAIGAMTK
jgi:hypothetical protein